MGRGGAGGRGRDTRGRSGLRVQEAQWSWELRKWVWGWRPGNRRGEGAQVGSLGPAEPTASWRAVLPLPVEGSCPPGGAMSLHQPLGELGHGVSLEAPPQPFRAHVAPTPEEPALGPFLSNPPTPALISALLRPLSVL